MRLDIISKFHLINHLENGGKFSVSESFSESEWPINFVLLEIVFSIPHHKIY